MFEAIKKRLAMEKLSKNLSSVARNNLTPNVTESTMLLIPDNITDNINYLTEAEKNRLNYVFEFMNSTTGVVAYLAGQSATRSVYLDFGRALHVYTDVNDNTYMPADQRELFEFTVFGLACMYSISASSRFDIDLFNKQIANIPMLGKLVLDSGKSVSDALLNPESKLMLSRIND